MIALEPAKPCPHCGYAHIKLGGHVKWYVGALVCPVYVALVLEDSENWGVRVRTSPKKGRETRLMGCAAPSDFTCFHKGPLEPSGKKRCYSPDGFTTQVPEERKLRLVAQGDAIVDAVVNEQELCPHVVSYRRAPVRRSGKRARRHGGGGTNGAVTNLMPGGNDPRKQAVYSELWARVEYLREHALPVKAETIAALAGHAAWKNRDVHV